MGRQDLDHGPRFFQRQVDLRFLFHATDRRFVRMGSLCVCLFDQLQNSLQLFLVHIFSHARYDVLVLRAAE